jgi:hypothetical protein
MKLVRDLRKRFGISAPMAVKIKLPWYWRGIEMAIAIATLLALALWTFYLGHKFAGLMADGPTLAPQPEAQELPQEPKEAVRLLQIERAARDHLARQVKLLDDENSRLKDDLSFFQSLMPAGNKEGISINQLRLERDMASGDYRYRFFLVQTGNRQRDFKGNLELIVNLRDEGTHKTISLPDAETAVGNRVSFKFYQRVEGTFRVDADAAVTGLEVRVFENGVEGPRAAQSVTLS